VGSIQLMKGTKFSGFHTQSPKNYEVVDLRGCDVLFAAVDFDDYGNELDDDDGIDNAMYDDQQDLG
jgi:hypothetical protein